MGKTVSVKCRDCEKVFTATISTGPVRYGRREKNKVVAHIVTCPHCNAKNKVNA